jgi:general secretion pathway protein E
MIASQCEFIGPLGEVQVSALDQPSSGYFEVLRHRAGELGLPAVHFESGLLLVGKHKNAPSDSKLLHIMHTAVAAQINVSSIRLTDSARVMAVIKAHEQPGPQEDNTISEVDSIRMFTDIMAEAHALGAQDIYIVLSKENNQAYCQYKVDNDLIDHMKWLRDFSLGYAVCAALFDGKESAGQSVGHFDESTTRQETQFKHRVYDQHQQLAEEYSIRFTKSKTSKIGELLVQMRLQPVSNIRRLADLAIQADTLAAIKAQMLRSKGVMLTSGPVGSGKNTLLMAILLDYPQRVFIQTFEDPL